MSPIKIHVLVLVTKHHHSFVEIHCSLLIGEKIKYFARIQAPTVELMGQMLSRNVGNELPTNIAKHPRRETFYVRVHKVTGPVGPRGFQEV